MILAGDIGGTKCVLALYEFQNNIHRKMVARRYESRQFPTFHQLVLQFLTDTRAETANALVPAVEAAGFGFAGPVIEGKVKLTNLPWLVDGLQLATELKTKHVVLLNDLEATGYGLPLLQPSEVSVLNQGIDAPTAAQALLAAGTGLGEAILFWDGTRHVVAPTEGGHADFAPRTDPEIDLLRYLKKQHPCVSVELILSGRGFRSIHEFLDPSVRHPCFESPDPALAAPEITHLALEGLCAVCVRTLDLWVTIYGAEAGNLALKTLARGGIWIAGGIAVKIRTKMEDGTFFRAFCEKEKFAAMLAQVPVKMVLNEEAPLLGAMAQAMRAAGTA